MKKKLQVGFGFLVSAIFLGLAFSRMNFAQVREGVSTMHWGWALLFVFATIASFAWRAWRWEVILRPQGHFPPWRIFGPMMVGFAFNSVFPLRVGEFARPLALRKTEGIPMMTGLSSVVLERVLDMATLLALFAVAPYFLHLDPGISQKWGEVTVDAAKLQSLARGGSKIVLVLLLGVVAMLVDPIRNRALELVLRLPFADTMKQRLRDLSASVTLGFAALRRPWLVLLLVLHSAAIWGISGSTYVIMSKAFPAMPLLSFTQAMAFLVITCTAIMIPAAPGYWGLFEIGGLVALQLCGVVPQSAAGTSLALTFTLVLHVLQWIPITVIGMLYAFRIHVSMDEAQSAKEPPG